MTIEEQRKAIIEDAKAAGFELTDDINYYAANLEQLVKFAQLQAARNQSNNVPVAWLNSQNGLLSFNKYNDNDTPLYTSPQPSNALEMAAKVCDEIGKDYSKLAKTDALYQYIVDGARMCAQEIRALIPQPESDGK
jgi:hypothetical protein